MDWHDCPQTRKMDLSTLEWLYRLCLEPKRMWRRYLLGNPLFLWNVMKERFGVVR